MSTLQDFDLRVRGVVNLTESWRHDTASLRLVWKIEDVVAQFRETYRLAFDLFEDYCERGSFPNPSVTFDYFAGVLEDFVKATRELVEFAQAPPFGDYAVDGLVALKQELQRAVEILEEDDYATGMAMLCDER